MLREQGEQGILLHCGRGRKWVRVATRKPVWTFLKTLNINLLPDLGRPPLALYPEKSIIEDDSCTLISRAALLNLQDRASTKVSINRDIKRNLSIETLEYTQPSEQMEKCHFQEHGWTESLQY